MTLREPKETRRNDFAATDDASDDGVCRNDDALGRSQYKTVSHCCATCIKRAPEALSFYY